MKRIIFVLISAIVVFVATLAFTNHFISEKAIESSDTHNTQMLDAFSDQFNDELSRTEQAACSFLSAEFSTHYDTILCTKKKTKTKTKVMPVFYISDENKKLFKE